MMSLNALKETKNTAVRYRLPTRSPPGSPSRRGASSSSTTSLSGAVGRQFKSRILATLDDEIDLENFSVKPPSAGGSGAGESAEKGKGKEKAQVMAQALKPASGAAALGRGLANPGIHPFFMQTGSRQPVSAAAAVTAVSSSTFSASSTVVDAATASKPASNSRTKRATTSASTDKDNEAAGETVLYSYKDYKPGPALVYTCHEEEANDLISGLKGPLGFDMEWRVLFSRGLPPKSRRTALIQLCDKHMILLIQISAMRKFPQKLKEIIENPAVPKLGANIRNDGLKLFADFGIAARNLVELSMLAHAADPAFGAAYKRPVVSLARMVARYCDGKTLDKGSVRMGNWEAAPLNATQQTYAANDVHCALMVYNRLLEIAEAEGITPDPTKYASDIALEKPAAPVVAKTASSSTVSTTSTASTASTSATTAATTTTTTTATTATTATPTAPAAASTSSSSAAAPPPRTYDHAAADVQAPLKPPPRPQHLRAYTLWHARKMSLEDMRAALRTPENPLAASTVISYVVGALQADETLPYELDALRAFVQLEAGSWMRHRAWIWRQTAKKRVS